LIAEPWAASGTGDYQLGNFPTGWSEWNGKYRDTVRKNQNVAAGVPPATLATRIAGSSDLFKDDGRKPAASVNFLVAHDGFTLRDLYSYDAKNNAQPWPYGPSDGGESNNVSWDQGGEAVDQRQAARTGLALLMLSVGVPMMTGGDEMYRTQYGNNNAYNVDSDKNWLDWSDATTNAEFLAFAGRMIRFRNAHAALRRADWFTGTDGDHNGLKDITWIDPTGAEASSTYKNATTSRFFAYRIDGTEGGDTAKSIYVGYNGGAAAITVKLPAASGWYRVADTGAWMESVGNSVDPGDEKHLGGGTYDLAARSLVLLIEE
jgi:isoamylase